MPALEVGCGYNRDPSCDTFMDANPNIPGLDYCGSLPDPLPWPDCHFDKVVARDCLEHIGYRKTLDVLIELNRVLKVGGKLYVQVPDCGRIMSEWAVDPHRWDERVPEDLAHLPSILGVAWRILGGQEDGTYAKDGDNPYLNLHLAMFDRTSLQWYLGQAGFTIDSLESNLHPNLLCWATKG